LFVTFDKRCAIPDKSSLTFYEDSQLLKPLHTIQTSNQFDPLIINNLDSIYFKFSGNSKNTMKYWGYKFTVIPCHLSFNLAMFIFQYLLEESQFINKTSSIAIQIFKAIFEYLYSSNIPVSLKVILLRLLSKLLQSKASAVDNEQIRKSDPQRMRDVLKSELDSLLKESNRSTLTSTYIQALSELIVNMKKAESNSGTTVTVDSVKDMPLIDQVSLLNEVVSCILQRTSLPKEFMNIVWKQYQHISRSTEEISTLVKLFEPNLTLNAIRDPLLDIFSRFDLDKDNFLSLEEFNNFSLTVGSSPLEAPQFAEFLQRQNSPDADKLSNDTFVEWQVKDMVSPGEKASFVKRLIQFGYEPCLHIHPSTPPSNQVVWSLDMDMLLLDFINSKWQVTGIDSVTLPTIAICMDSSSHNLLQSVTIQDIRVRFSAIKVLNQLLLSSLPLIDLQSTNFNSLADKLSKIREYIFFDTKLNYLKEILTSTICSAAIEPPTVHLARLDGFKQYDTSKENPHCVYMQLYRQLNTMSPLVLRQKDRSFKVIFKGENAEGEVGPYRESLNHICIELQSSVMNLLIPCPNQESTGIGQNREKFIINPSVSTPKYLEMFQFLGKLIGISIRSRTPLSLDLPSLVWKPLVFTDLDKRDVKDIDYSTIESLDAIETMSKDVFESSIFNTFVTSLSDKQTTVDLKPNGSKVTVTFEDRHEYVNACINARLFEHKLQMESIMKGLSQLVPLSILKLFTWQDLR
jgi:hypothetical protein